MSPLPFADIDWPSIIANVGFPAAVLAAFSLAAWRGLAWIGREIIVPLRDRLLARMSGFFDRVDNALESITDHMRQQTEAMQKLQHASEQNNQAWLSVRDTMRCHYKP